MARHQFRQFNRQSRPNRGWAGAVASAPIAVPASSKVLAATLALDNDGIDETILRVVGGIAIQSDAVASEIQVGAIGMCLVTDTAAALGITAVPDPVTDVQDDVWFFYLSFAQKLQVFDATGANPNFATWYPFDQKAKRIFSSGNTVAVVVANAHATHGFEFMLNDRVLTQVRGTR